MVAVQQVIDAQALHLGVVTCPAPHRNVRWVATNEMTDPRPFLEGGELLLFTGLGMSTWDGPKWVEYVERVAQAEISALALAVGITHAEVPPALASACTDQGVNLLTVPMETSFVAISQTVAGMLEASDRAAARGAVAMQRRLAQAARRSDAALAVSEELAAYVAGSVWVMSPEGQVIKQAGGTASRHAEVLTEIGAELGNLSSRGLGASASWSSGPEHTILQPIGLRSPAPAYLAVRTPGPLTEYQRTAILTSLSMLTLEIESREEVRRTARMLARRAIDLLVEGESRAAAVVLQAALRDADVSRILPRTAAVVRVAGTPERLLGLLAGVEEGRPPGARVAAMSADGRELQMVVAAKRLEAFVSALPDGDLRVGVGSVVTLSDLGASMRSAGQALARCTWTNRVTWWRQLKDEGVTRLIGPDTRAVLVEELLASLQNSPVGAQELLRVASSFLRHHGRMNVVGEELGMHRNTARARVQELERVLGYDLQDPGARAALWISLEALGEHMP